MVKKKILIIDDEAQFCEFVKRGLENTDDFSVEMATTGVSGVSQAKVSLPDLILLDVMMPGVDGLKVLELLKEDKMTMGIPVVMVTAREDERTKLLAAQLFNERYLTKPITIKELQDKITRVLVQRGV